MAKGITEAQVHAAADTLLAGGERPTVDRLRAQLGTGSPNTVTRWLDTWWRGLGARLQAQQCKVALPEAPAGVVAAASQLWEQALGAAQAVTDNASAAERQALAEARAALDGERSALAATATQQQARVEQAEAAAALHAVRLSEAQRMIEQQAAQLADLSQQRDALQQRVQTLGQQIADSDARLHAQAAAATAEREAHRAHTRAVEDRAHQEIDRARQDGKELKQQIATFQREHRAAQVALVAAHREAGEQRARADALAQQFTSLRMTLTPPRKPATKRSAAAPAKKRRARS